MLFLGLKFGFLCLGYKYLRQALFVNLLLLEYYEVCTTDLNLLHLAVCLNMEHFMRRAYYLSDMTLLLTCVMVLLDTQSSFKISGCILDTLISLSVYRTLCFRTWRYLSDRVCPSMPSDSRFSLTLSALGYRSLIDHTVWFSSLLLRRHQVCMTKFTLMWLEWLLAFEMTCRGSHIVIDLTAKRVWSLMQAFGITFTILLML